MARITIDPVTRIEGHLRVEAEVEGGKVTDAWSSGTMFRGIELIIKGKDPREAWVWAQRICGVCTTVHALASVRAVENALDVTVPDNAHLVRNLIAAAQYAHDHVVHFYHLHALDWVDVTTALRADPNATSRLARSLSDWPKSSAEYFGQIQQRVQGLVDSGQLSLFASGYWGHPAYQLPPEASLLAVAHYIEALEWQREVVRIHAVLGGKNPHPQTYLVGGMAVTLDPKSPAATVTPERVTFLRDRIKSVRQFVEQVYVPDVLAIASYYPEWLNLGSGLNTFMCYGGFPQGTAAGASPFLFPRGIVRADDLSSVRGLDPGEIQESVSHSWYTYAGGGEHGKHPFDGETEPRYVGPPLPYDRLDTSAKYSWIKSPRYGGEPMETGPLARVLVSIASGNLRMRALVDGVMRTLHSTPDKLVSTLGRVVARAIETQFVAERMDGWLDELSANLSSNNLSVHDGSKWDPKTWPRSARGYGLDEAPRGSLGHWVEISDAKVSHYQVVAPTTWNAGPRDASGQRGAYEAALLGTPVADVNRPLELLRTIHSFDPCLACAVHVVDARGRQLSLAEAL